VTANHPLGLFCGIADRQLIAYFRDRYTSENRRFIAGNTLSPFDGRSWLSDRAIRDRLDAFGHSSTARLEPPGPCRPRYQSTVAWHAAAYGVGGNARAGSEVDARNQGCADLDKFWSATSPQSASPRTKVHRVYPVMQRRQRPLF